MMAWLETWLTGKNLPAELTGPLAYGLGLLALACFCWIVNYIAKKILLNLVYFFAKKSKNTFDDELIRNRVFQKLSHIAPALVLYFFSSSFPLLQEPMERLSMAYIIFTALSAGISFINAVGNIYRQLEVSRTRPIGGYLQILKFIVVLLTLIFVIATLMDRSPWGILSGIGAMSAVMLLVFKDAILGMVAGFQLSASRMVQVGDWIEMPKYGADGDVIDINLTTVKVQNWDKTVSTIPIYALVSDSFKNWRGMSESGGRRIKRSLYLDVSSVRFLDDEDLKNLENIQCLRDYLNRKKKELGEYNLAAGASGSHKVNGRRLTNLGTFRAYIVEYLKQHPKIHKNMTFLVRQLQPGETGLPLEIYVFSNDQEWAHYENIQSDIFDHLLAAVPEFGLRVFQNPSGHDFQSALSRAPSRNG